MITNEQIEQLRAAIEDGETHGHGVVEVATRDLRAAIDTLEKLPVTADGVRVGPDERVFTKYGESRRVERAVYATLGCMKQDLLMACYSTDEAAEQAIKETNG